MSSLKTSGGRCNKRHFARQNHGKKASDQYEKKFRNVVLSLVQMNGLLVQVVIQGAKGGIVYSVHGWDIKLPTILTMANRYHNPEYTN